MRVTISTTLLNHVLSLRFGRRSLTEYYLTRDVQHSETILNLAELLFLQANCGPGGVLQACSFRGRFPNRLGFNTRPGVFRSLQESSDSSVVFRSQGYARCGTCSIPKWLVSLAFIGLTGFRFPAAVHRHFGGKLFASGSVEVRSGVGPRQGFCRCLYIYVYEYV